MNMHRTFFKTTLKGVVAGLVWGGLSVLIIGVLMGHLPYSSAKIIGDILVKFASALLGAGVFAALMKSAQFTEIFQKQIFEVFNDPKKLGEIVDVAKRWNILTAARLKDVLPDIYTLASQKNRRSFF